MTIVDSFENGTSDSHAEDSALLGISPNEPISEASLTSRFLNDQKKQMIKSSSKQHGFTTLMQADAFIGGDNYHNNNDDEYDPPLPMVRRPRSGSEGLDCLAALAEQERSRLISSSSDEEEDTAAMPPPPCRRPRSVSNPEGMDQYQSKQQFRLAIPESILEEELAEASRAVQNAERPDILLKNARARLLEDVALEKGLPHTLSKYKNIYNRDGRIGIYTPRERAAILARYRDKRTRRNWNKKIRYNCRKSLADRRVRVKGRFVKRSEQEALLLLKQQNKQQPQDSVDEDYDGEEEEEEDDDMPDVNDPEAGFCPTEDQPYRRFRRHTIT